MNWGNSIVLVFVVFAAIVFTMVGICIKQDDIHLVTENYYEAEIKYQEQIEKVSNAALLSEKVMDYDPSEKELNIHLDDGVKGTVWLFRPSDARLDQEFNFEIDQSEEKKISLNKLEQGYWKVKIAWTNAGKEYFEELKISL
ncbi:FixH family protein [Echinicola marina]|uniref:FixH family protein n=1 Tax=Echinicola marina TaxID=2859768 RepID=UPI001CF61144|nr:FixH family protein [Echinicola marina]UCS93013.1 FixH family protein [Echinicola marina]